MSANGIREGNAYDPLDDAVLAAMVASGMPAREGPRKWASSGLHEQARDAATIVRAARKGSTVPRPTREQALAWALEDEPAPSVLAWGEVPDEPPTVMNLGALDDLEGHGRGPT